MSLAGLLAAVAEDPQLSTALADQPDGPGGVRDLDGAIRCVELHCDRIGASRTAEILDALKARPAGEAEPVAPVSRGNDGY